MLKSAGINTANIAAASAPSTPSLVTKLASGAIPFVIAPTGTMANNGAITLGTALPTTYANCYLNLPASAIQAGSAAGWYYAQMSSTTVGQVFNNTYSSGVPSIPASPTAFVSTGPGAYTGVTTQQSGPQISIPAGLLGANGSIRTTSLWSVLNNANAKTITVAIASVNILSASAASVGCIQVQSKIENRGVQNLNVSFPSANQTGLGTASGNANSTSIDFSAATTLSIAGTLGVATDFMVMESFLIEVMPG